HGRFGGRDALAQPNRFRHCLRSAYDFRYRRLALNLRAQSLIINTQVSLLSSLAHADVEFVDAVRFRKVIESPELHGFARRFDRALTGQHDHFRWVGPLMYP